MGVALLDEEEVAGSEGLDARGVDSEVKRVRSAHVIERAGNGDVPVGAVGAIQSDPVLVQIEEVDLELVLPGDKLVDDSALPTSSAVKTNVSIMPSSRPAYMTSFPVPPVMMSAPVPPWR